MNVLFIATAALKGRKAFSIGRRPMQATTNVAD